MICVCRRYSRLLACLACLYLVDTIYWMVSTVRSNQHVSNIHSPVDHTIDPLESCILKSRLTSKGTLPTPPMVAERPADAYLDLSISFLFINRSTLKRYILVGQLAVCVFEIATKERTTNLYTRSTEDPARLAVLIREPQPTQDSIRAEKFSETQSMA